MLSVSLWLQFKENHASWRTHMLSTCSANRALAIRAQEAGDDITGAKAGDDITGVGVSIKGSSMKDKVRNQREMISCKHGDFTLAVRFKQNRPRCM